MNRWILTAVIGLLAIGSAALFLRSSAPQKVQQQYVYVCSETGEIVVAAAEPTPAVNPKTGRRTLLRGLYCDQCRKWYSVPPARREGANPLHQRCPKHRTPLSQNGPLRVTDAAPAAD